VGSTKCSEQTYSLPHVVFWGGGMEEHPTTHIDKEGKRESGVAIYF
jgi:hypothetical protein